MTEEMGTASYFIVAYDDLIDPINVIYYLGEEDLTIDISKFYD